MSVNIDKTLFWARLKRVFDNWAKGGKAWGGGADAMIVNSGSASEDLVYSRSGAIHVFLLGYEFPDTVMVFTPGELTILCSRKKARYLEPLGTSNGSLRLTVIQRNKGDKDAANFAALVKKIKSSNKGQLLGWLPKERQEGKFIARWNQAWTPCGMTAVSVSLGFGRVMSVKDRQALKDVKTAASFTTKLYKSYLDKTIKDAIVDEKKMSHRAISDRALAAFDAPNKVDGTMSEDANVEACYDPVVMSGGDYSLNNAAESNDKPLQYGSGGKPGVILTRAGARFNNYCSNIARTIFINPSKDMEKAYTALTDVFKACLRVLRHGQRINDVYKTAMGVVKRGPMRKFADCFRGCGFGTGLEFREKNLILSEKNMQIFKDGHVVCFSIGFEGLKGTDGGGTYSMQIADTIQITTEDPILLTNAYRSWKQVAMDLADSDSDEASDEASDADAGQISHYEARRRKRAQFENSSNTAQARERERKQNELRKKKLEEMARRHAKDSVKASFDAKKTFDYANIRTYKTVSSFPKQARSRPNQLYVDMANEAIIVPVFKQLVPFHISTIRSVNKSEEGNETVLRINFATPGMSFKKNNDYIMAVPQDKFFVQELSFRSRGRAGNLERAYFTIQELRRSVKKRMKETEDRKSVIVQKALKPITQGGVLKLRDLSARPSLSRKRSTGVLEAHKNGLRFYQTRDAIKVDVIYENIKHAFFQKVERSTEVILHFELHNNIMWGKKKTDYVQFYVEVVASSQDLQSGTRWHDADGLIEEQEERRRKRRFNTIFRDFAKKLENVTKRYDPKNEIVFEEPQRSLGFTGVPHKEAVECLPTGSCLIALDNKPRPFVACIDDVDVAVLERVRYSLKNFDLTLIHKDYTRFDTIVSIPSKKIEDIKNYLNATGLPYYERPDPLKTANILDTIRQDIPGFIALGGWEDILKEGYIDEHGDEMEDDSGSAWEADEEDDEDPDDEEFDSGSEVEESESGSDYQDDDDEDAEDWDELDRKAAAQDRKRARDDRDFERRDRQKRSRR